MTLRVRALEPGDYQRWLELWNGYLAFYKEDLPKAITELTWQRLLSKGQDHEGLVVLDDQGRITGIAHYLLHRSTWAEGWYCYLEDLFVDPLTRGQGAGRALIEAVMEEARAKGCSRTYLVTQDTNVTAQALYEKVMIRAPFVQYRTRDK